MSRILLILLITLSLVSLVLILILGVRRPQNPAPSRAASSDWSSPCTLIGSSITSPNLAAAPDGTLYAAAINQDDSTNPPRFLKFDTNCHSMDIPLPTLQAQAYSPVLGGTQAQTPHISVNKNGDVAVTYRVGFRLYYARLTHGSNSFHNPVLVNDNAYMGDIALDSAGNVHIVWYSPNGYYRKYGPADQLLIDTITLTSTTNDAEPKLALDSGDNLHLIWMDSGAKVVHQEFFATGAKSTPRTLTPPSNFALFPQIKIDSGDNIHLAWQGSVNNEPYQAYYETCNPTGENCSTPVNLSHTGQNSTGVGVGTCNHTPIVVWNNGDQGTQLPYVSLGLTGTPEQPTASQWGDFLSLAVGGGKAHLIFRQENNTLGYVSRALPDCSVPAPVPPVPPPVPDNTKCQGNTNPPVECVECKKDGQINILDFACFSQWYGKNNL